MKKIALSALTVALMVGCTVERTIVQEPAPTTIPAETTPETTPAPTQPPTTPAPAGGDEDGFLASLHSQVPITRGIDDLTLLDTAWAVCTAISGGATLDDIASTIIASASSAESEDMLTWVSVYAVMYLCPEYDYIMDTDY